MYKFGSGTMKHPHTCGAPKWDGNENDDRMMSQPTTNKIPTNYSLKYMH